MGRPTRRGDKHVRVRRAQEQPQRPRPERRRRACTVDRLAQAHNLTLRDSRATICYGGSLLGWIGLSAKDLSKASRHPAWRHTSFKRPNTLTNKPHGLHAADVRVIPAGSLPTTVSGKVVRTGLEDLISRLDIGENDE